MWGAGSVRMGVQNSSQHGKHLQHPDFGAVAPHRARASELLTGLFHDTVAGGRPRLPKSETRDVGRGHGRCRHVLPVIPKPAPARELLF